MYHSSHNEPRCYKTRSLRGSAQPAQPCTRSLYAHAAHSLSSVSLTLASRRRQVLLSSEQVLLTGKRMLPSPRPKLRMLPSPRPRISKLRLPSHVQRTRYCKLKFVLSAQAWARYQHPSVAPSHASLTRDRPDTQCCKLPSLAECLGGSHTQKPRAARLAASRFAKATAAAFFAAAASSAILSPYVY